MRFIKIRILCFCLFGILSIPAFSQNYNDLTKEQKDALALVNYFSSVQEEIYSYKKNKAYLDELYSNLRNYTKLSTLDSVSKDEFLKIMDTIHEYGMIDTKRERLEYLLENQKSEAIKSAVPSPLSVLNVIQSGNWIKALVSVTTMAVDSAVSYSKAKNQAEIEFLQKGWELDDKEAETLHQSVSDTLNYIWQILTTNNIEDIEGLRLNNNDIKKFVDYKFSKKSDGSPDYARREMLFESADSKKKYSGYAPYYLALVDTYYNLNEFKKCINALTEYEKTQGDIFRKDFEFAKAIPMAISSASEIYKGEKYIAYCEKYLQKLIDNTETENWDLRYFAAQIYLSLSKVSGDNNYLTKAYNLSKQNVLSLLEEQKKQNNTYLSNLSKPTQETDKKKLNNKENKEKAGQKYKSEKDFYKYQKNSRKTALPPVSDPLLLNCQLLYSLMDKIQILKSEESSMRNILNGVFLNFQVDTAFSNGQIANQQTADQVLNEIIYAKNPELKEHTSSFQTTFINSFSQNYRNILKKNLNLSNDNQLNEVLILSNSIGAEKVSWNKSNKMKIPAKYFIDGASVTINVYSATGEQTIENADYKVLNVKRPKNKTIEDFTATVSFKSSMKGIKYKGNKSYTVVVKIKVSDKEKSFVFLKNTGVMFGWFSKFELLNYEALTALLKDEKFNFPEKTGGLSSHPSYGEPVIYETPSLEHEIKSYTLAANSKENMNEYPLAFKDAYVAEYSNVYFETLKTVFRITNQKQLLDIIEADLLGNNLKVQLNKNTLKVLAKEVISGFTLDITILDENDNQIQSISDVKKSVENVKTDKNDIQSSVAVIKIQDTNFTKFKFEKKKMYKYYFTITNNSSKNTIIFLKAENGKIMSCNEYVAYKVSKLNEKK